MNTKKLYQLFIKNQLTINTDSRKKILNSIFFALKGENFDGNKYALQALEDGALYAVIDNEIYFDNSNDRLIPVKNSLETLQELAKYHREQLNIPIIGLTGSNGKTTTKELIHAVLREQFNVLATTGNLNNHIGVPLTLLNINSSHEIAIIEMGANHPKEIEFLCNIAQPSHGYITNFGKAHLEGFGSLEGVVKAKRELYNFIDAHNGVKFINGTDKKQLEITKDDSNTVVFCDTEKCQYIIKLIDSNPFVQVFFKELTITSQLIGQYNFNNIAAAIAIGSYFKVPKELIKKGIENYKPTNNRSQIIQQGTNKIILDAYNANPTSTLAAIQNFAQLSDTNKLVVLGDMFELGKTAQEEHQYIANQLGKLGFTNVLLVGKNYAGIKTSFLQFDTFDLVENYLSANKPENSSILIKGSRGMQLERTLKLL
jgi:UDP-N-acetylmuramoyl-tripeptide--D-alanyl-D-alanine ligase